MSVVNAFLSFYFIFIGHNLRYLKRRKDFDLKANVWVKNMAVSFKRCVMFLGWTGPCILSMTWAIASFSSQIVETAQKLDWGCGRRNTKIRHAGSQFFSNCAFLATSETGTGYLGRCQLFQIVDLIREWDEIGLHFGYDWGDTEVNNEAHRAELILITSNPTSESRDYTVLLIIIFGNRNDIFSITFFFRELIEAKIVGRVTRACSKSQTWLLKEETLDTPYQPFGWSAKSQD